MIDLDEAQLLLVGRHQDGDRARVTGRAEALGRRALACAQLVPGIGLVDLADLAASVDAWLLIDDAHGFGVLGKRGRGWCVDQLAEAPATPRLQGTCLRIQVHPGEVLIGYL